MKKRNKGQKGREKRQPRSDGGSNRSGGKAGGVHGNEVCSGGMVFRRINKYKPQRSEGAYLFSALTGDGSCVSNQLIFMPSAVRRLKSFTDWGKRTPRNLVEQQGILLGQVYETPHGFVGVVENVILSQAQGNGVYVECAHSEWGEMDRLMDEENLHRKYKLVKVGWWHTHPNMAVFMSSTDRSTQRNYFSEEWQFAAVLNPQQRVWGAFVGENAAECDGYFIELDLKKLKRAGLHSERSV